MFTPSPALPVTDLFEAAGYARIEPDILQPADIFLDLSGEEIRHRLLLTTDNEGREWALRPEFTIPVARAYLASGTLKEAGFSYYGPVFRAHSGEPSEFIQAGIESFGRRDSEAADAEILARALEALRAVDETKYEIRLGDMGLFAALLEALGLPAVWQRRLRRAFAKGALDASSLASFANEEREPSEHAGLLKAMQGQDPRAARGFVEDLLKIAGISSVGGRSAGEIAERFLSQASREDEGSFSEESRSVLERFLAIEGDPDSVAHALRVLNGEAELNLDLVIDAFETRAGFYAARGIDLNDVFFSARFGRNLDYYTGAVFEIRRKTDQRVVVGGGRYDRLLKLLGAADGIPAVGCAVFIDRLQGGAA